MLKLLKYDIRECYKPFLWAVIYTVVTQSAACLNVFGNSSYKNINGDFYLVDVILIIIGSWKFYSEFYTEKNTLGFIIPVSIVKRVFSRLLSLNLCYIVLQSTRVVFNIINPNGSYTVLKTYFVNYKPYILYDFTGGILFYASTLAIITLGMVLANSITRNFVIIPILNIIIIGTLMVSSVALYGTKINKDYPYEKGVHFQFREGLSGEVNVSFRSNYSPFLYGQRGILTYNLQNLRERIDVSYSWSGVEYSAVCLIISLAGSAGLVKRKGAAL